MFAMLGGVAFWLLDAVFDKFILFSLISFCNIFLKDAPTQSFYSQPVVIIIVVVITIIVALIPKKLLENQNRCRELLQNINDGIVIMPVITSNGTYKYMEVNYASAICSATPGIRYCNCAPRLLWAKTKRTTFQPIRKLFKAKVLPSLDGTD